jgi:two-component system, OmpR family, copper resistance phosphate regulon response regulator CusR
MRILLIEDEKGVAGFIRKGLEEEQYGVDVATDGEEGLALADAANYDLIVLDIMLPRMNGIEVCKQLRQRGVKTPILMLTARDAVEDKVRGLDSGADDYLTKPFLFDEFLARVRALLRRKSTEINELQCKDLRLDVHSHRAYTGDKELVLRPKEFALLEYLLRNKGRVLSRTQILENIWGYNHDPATNIVDVHVKTLREKISRRSKAEYIRTVRGTGYIIEDR